MNNNIIDRIRSRVIVSIKGKSPERFILKLKHKKINIYELNKVDDSCYKITIDYKNFEKIIKIKTIYEIKIEKYLGIENSKRLFFKYYHLIIIGIISILAINIFSNIITDVSVITNDNNMEKLLIRSLNKYGITKYSFQKSYDYLEEVKKNIIEEYHNEIEWIEIEKKGTKYIIKYEPRIIKDIDEKKEYSHIVANKNAVIRSIFSSSGQIIKKKNDFVKKGDIIISGDIYSNGEYKETIHSEGIVYGEVWYITKVVYPFNYYEQIKTGRKKDVYSIKFLNKKFYLFNFNSFNDKIIKEYVLFKNNVIPFSLNKEHQEEVIVKSSMNVIEELKINAIELAYTRMNEKLKDGEYIINHKVLDSKIIDKGIEMKIFFSVCESIGKQEKIEQMKEVE